MPEIKFTEVKGYTSQDEKHPAENLLNGNVTDGKWLISSSSSVTSMAATFQLAECCVISSVHIGNSGSAFVSLLVSRTGCSEFKDLLPCSALMTMQESKRGQNKSCVKMFVRDDFLEETKEEKWDQLRVVVTQPFNHRLQFGLCFVRVFSFDKEETKNSKINSDSFSKWEKMRSQISNPLSPLSSKLAGRQLSASSPLSRSDKLLLQVGQQHNKLQEEEKTTSTRAQDEEEDEAFFETSVLSFMESLNLQDKDLDNIRLIEVQKNMEQVQGRELSPQERRIFVAVVKKYVMSLRDVKSSSIKSQHYNQSTKTDHCSKEEFPKPKELGASIDLPHSVYCGEKDHISDEDCDANKSRDGPGGLSAKRYYSTDASTSKTNSYLGQSPTVRRNLISLEDAEYTHEGLPDARDVSDKPVGGDRCFMNADSRETSKCVVQPNLEKVLKRKSSEIYGANKKYCAVDCDKLATTGNCEVLELQEMNPASEHFSGDLVECPVCRVHFESDVIENHSWECVSSSESPVREECIIQEVTCPLCLKKMSSAIIDVHANMCASEMFGD